MKDINLLKEVLSVPTKTNQEHRMVEFLVNWLTENNIKHYVDDKMNVYATKQETSDIPEDFYFPCVISHTDTVHHIDTINIREMMLENAQGELKPSLKAFNNSNLPTGIGGDDKCGVFACLTLLKELPNLKQHSLLQKKLAVTVLVPQILRFLKMLDMVFSLMPLKIG